MNNKNNIKQSVVDLVVDYIVNSIIDQTLKPGDRLPTEPALSEQLGVGRNSVREAVKQLEAFGVLYIKRADGTFVSDCYTQKMLDPILYSIIMQKYSWGDFVQLRKVIDTGTLHVLISSGNTNMLIPQLEALLLHMANALSAKEPNVDEIMELDTRFHDCITLATNNKQLASISDYITKITIPSRRNTLKKLIQQKNTKVLIDLHSQIIETLRELNTMAIDDAITAHYQYWAT